MSQSEVVVPQQGRSVRSFARMRAAVVELLVTRGSADFTIAEVAEAAGTSIGSIYGRVGNKTALLRVVHDQELERIEQQTLASLSRAVERVVDFDNDLASTIDAYLDVLAENAALLRALIRLGDVDPETARRGELAGLHADAAFCDALRQIVNRYGLGASDKTVAWANELVYALAARLFGFGLLSSGQPLHRVELKAFKAELASTVAAYLRARALGEALT
jgi:AcrR family transcriptional regulator